MKRRDFLKQTAVMMTAAALPVSFPDKILASDKPVLAVSRSSSIPEMVKKALTAVGGIKAFVKPGCTVVIKPNIGWDRVPEQAANTHPEVVAELARQCLATGAAEVKIFDRTCNDPRRCYHQSGIQPAIEALNDRRVRCIHPDDRKYLFIPLKKGRSLKSCRLYADAIHADVYINVPVAKHHSLAGLSLGLKNVMGVLGGNRGILHQDIGQRLADVATALKPHLTVIDATRILLRNGPQGGRLKDVKQVNTIIASADPVAADAWATTLFSMKPERISSTVAAHKMGLGEMDFSRMNIIEV